MSVEIVRDNIVNRPVDAIVNAANSKLRAGGGVCGAIFEAAGYHELTHACMNIGFCQAGNAVITPGFGLKAKYIIHAVGPVWRGGGNDEEDRLFRAYLSSLELADENGCDSVAFPLISSGIYGMPKDIALDCARRAFQEFPNERDMRIELVLFDKASVEEGLRQLGDIRAYIDDRYAEAHDDAYSRIRFSNEPDLNLDLSEIMPETAEAAPDTGDSADATIGSPSPEPDSAPAPKAPKRKRKRAFANLFGQKPDHEENLREAIDLKSATFSQTLLHMIDERGLTDPQVYHRANIDRKLFSKIRSDEDYSPSKRTAVQLAIALDLDREQADFLLQKAGYAFSPASEEDLIVCYFIEHGDCDIFHINEALFYFDKPLLCG